MTANTNREESRDEYRHIEYRHSASRRSRSLCLNK